GELPCVKPTPCPASPTEARLDGRETPPLSPGRRRCRLPPRGKGPAKVHLRSSVDLVDQFPGDHWNQMKHGRNSTITIESKELKDSNTGAIEMPWNLFRGSRSWEITMLEPEYNHSTGPSQNISIL
ncbi:hypothetical protein CHARACLAT_033610, partial [Characodon lateralis]|nr:hypothetical protein [Characodon lateralis]